METIKIITLMLLMIVGLAGAAETFVNAVDVDSTIWDTPAPDWWGLDNPGVAWTHSVPAEAIGNITAASLTIDVSGLCEHDKLFSPADDHVTILLNGTDLGELTGLTTVFTGNDVINALAASTPTQATIAWDWAGAIHIADAAHILTSTLEGEYCAVPAPGALALAGIGMTFVGFLRNRKNAVQV